MSCLFFPFVLSQGFQGAHSNRLADIYLHTVVLGICVNEPQLVILLEQVQPWDSPKIPCKRLAKVMQPQA
jgi:hypothetical protein